MQFQSEKRLSSTAKQNFAISCRTSATDMAIMCKYNYHSNLKCLGINVFKYIVKHDVRGQFFICRSIDYAINHRAQGHSSARGFEMIYSTAFRATNNKLPEYVSVQRL